jgi:hypothetical protein
VFPGAVGPVDPVAPWGPMPPTAADDAQQEHRSKPLVRQFTQDPNERGREATCGAAAVIVYVM